MSAEEKKNNLQETFLIKAKNIKAPVTLFLVSGIKLQGIITEFDSFSVLLQRENSSRENNSQNHYQLVYKHAIATILPSDPFQLFKREKRTAQEKVE